MVATRILLDDVRLDIRSICEAGSGEEAIWRARVYKPHAVPMDIKMPGLDGFEVATKIKEERPSAAILMVTAVEEPGQRQKATMLGAAGFLTKDRVATDLVSLLAPAFSRPSVEG